MAIQKKNSAISGMPDTTIKVKTVFGFASSLAAPAFSSSEASGAPEHVPAIDPSYSFDPKTTEAILAGFARNRRVLVQGWHGTGKSTHIEQVAARLNWPLIRINLDGHVSRIDLIGRDAITLREGKQVTEFREGILPWAMQRGIALVFDEYDAGRPDVMFVLQRLLEAEGKLTLTEQNRVLTPHPAFRLFATANTVGLGDATGLYHGTNPINQGQLDRWNIVAQLDYLSAEKEEAIMLARLPGYATPQGHKTIRAMVVMAALTREGFKHGEISTVMSPRTVLSWAENAEIFGDVEHAFRLSFLNKCDRAERSLIAEYYQRCFGVDLPEGAVKGMLN